ncbi:putative secreted protein (Por secretion system target) [Gelidibacter algens]|uniref:Putative secreted protein (Por secretion system target) n=1 Tax=Gelidibacter algens TaxID=49280 RepID=A0A1A7R204_9FLAO|nr:T9SS type A sorting domain-containing protein [Gelidibacter algens]OBX25509.1 hypothetical protein A9996_09380 [Gelidibacter algens]RAJ22235.1 putative secreted protein (Por secretion system target) [Gelidibacter algens]
MRTLITSLFIFSLSMSICSQSREIAAFSGTSTPAAKTLNGTITATALSRGPGLIDAGGATFNSGGWTTDQTLDVNDYIEWSVTAAPGYEIKITSLQIDYTTDASNGKGASGHGKGPKEVSIRTNADNFTKDIYFDKNGKDSGKSPVISTDLSAKGGIIIFRLYGYKAKGGKKSEDGTLAIEGGLGNILQLEHTGIILEGTVTYEGLVYNGTKWSPSAPEENTGTKDILIEKGMYIVTNNIKAKNFTVAPGAGLVVKNTGSITVNGNLITSDNVTLESSSTQYSSLIVNGTVTGTTKYERHINTQKGGNDLVSAPVSDETFDTFRTKNPNIISNATNTLFLFGVFNKTTGTFVNYSNTENTPLKAGMGYRTASSDNSAFTFTGKVNTAPVNVNIYKSGPYSKSWNLVGNPYPSYIDTETFLKANVSQLSPTAAAIYGFDGKSSDGWTIVNLATLPYNQENARITPGQGFFLSSKNDVGAIIFTPEMRTTGNTDDFILGRNTSDAYKLGFVNLKISSHTQQYRTELYFNDASSKGMDAGYDASIYGGTAPAFAVYSHLVENNEGDDMAIQSLNFEDLQNDVIVPLGVNAASGQQITLSIAESILPEGTEVYLEDNLKNTFTLLNSSDYIFTAESNLASTGRFYLRFSNTTLSTDNTDTDIVRIFTNNTSRTLIVKGQLQSHTLVTIYDLQGRLMSTKELNGNSQSHEVDMSNLRTGVYIVKLKNKAQEKTQKVMLK